MKKLIACLTFFLAITIVSFAQNHNQKPKEPKTPEERAERQTQKLNKELSLTAEQTTKVKEVLLKKDQEAEAVRAKYANATDKSPMKQEMKTIKDQTDSSLKEIFTADQYTKYEAMKDEHHGGDHKGGNGGHGGGHGGQSGYGKPNGTKTTQE